MRCGNVEEWSRPHLARLAALQPGSFARLDGRLVGAALQDGPELLLAVAGNKPPERTAVATELLSTHSAALECWIATRNPDLAAALSSHGWLPSTVDLQMRLGLPPHRRPLPSGIDFVDLTGPDDAALLIGAHELANAAWGVDGSADDFLDRFVRPASYDPALWVLAYERGIPCGAAIGHLLQLPDALVGKVASLAVAPRARGRGLGAAMLAELCHRFASRGLPLAQLGVHEDNRSGAPAMYRHLGWEQVSSRTRWQSTRV